MFVGRNRRSSDAPLSTFDNTEGMGDSVFRSEPESVSPVTQDGVELADSQSDSDPPEEFLPSAMQPQPVLLEDPLVLNSPHISIPKKHKAVFKHNQWPLRTTFPSVSISCTKVPIYFENAFRLLLLHCACVSSLAGEYDLS